MNSLIRNIQRLLRGFLLLCLAYGILFCIGYALHLMYWGWLASHGQPLP